ncbi:hypothetical protein [Rhizobium mesoamericanum]|uniref:hypothetical protein n=1 Tax=Rhizobium mesoamericanum TaxID=1079800 RepID=UPI000410CCDC|nr:hypothetical protein [Rhizobium mesoamericanum]
MEIVNLRPPYRPQDEALFDLQFGPNLRIFNLALRRFSDGRYRVLAPNAFGKHSASFTPELAIEITKAALAAMGGAKPDDRTKAA